MTPANVLIDDLIEHGGQRRQETSQTLHEEDDGIVETVYRPEKC